MKPPPIRNPFVLGALEVCELRGHRLVSDDPRSLTFSATTTTVDDVLWIRENLRALDRFSIRLPLTSRDGGTP